MYALPRTNYLRRSFVVNNQKPSKDHDVITQGERIKRQLRSLGATHYDLMTMESRYLPHIIHPNEYIQGVVYGWLNGDAVTLVATDRRVIFLDKKPLFVNEDEITYNVVSGVTYNQVGIGATVVLHTRVKDYTVHTLNKKCATGFVEYVEHRSIETAKNGGQLYDYVS